MSTAVNDDERWDPDLIDPPPPGYNARNDDDFERANDEDKKTCCTLKSLKNSGVATQVFIICFYIANSFAFSHIDDNLSKSNITIYTQALNDWS